MNDASSSDRSSRHFGDSHPGELPVIREQDQLRNDTKIAAPPQEARGTPDTEGDPFGNENNAAVKYKTMSWW